MSRRLSPSNQIKELSPIDELDLATTGERLGVLGETAGLARCITHWYTCRADADPETAIPALAKIAVLNWCFMVGLSRARRCGRIDVDLIGYRGTAQRTKPLATVTSTQYMLETQRA